MLNQGEFEDGNDECGGVSSSRILSFLNGYHVGPHFLWMMARQGAGEKATDYGVSNRDLADTLRHVGALRMEDEPFTFKDTRDVIQDPSKWLDIPGLEIKAAEQLAGSVIWIHPTNGMDAFDTFRATIARLNKLYGKIHGAVFGMMWNYPMSNITIEFPSETGSGHDIPLFWADGDYAFAIQSYGLSAGNNGEQKISRAVVNRWAEDFGMFIPIDATRAQIDAVLAKGGKLDDPWSTNIVRTVIDVFSKKKVSLTWLVQFLANFLNPKPMIPVKITKLATLIRDYEGGPGDRNYRNCNPGNARFHFGGYLPKYGVVKCDKDGFAIFETYELGWLYLQNMLLSWATGIYADESVLHMMTRYAPTSDGNDPVAYATFLANHLGVPASTPLKALLS